MLNHNYVYDTINNNNKVITVSVQLAGSDTIIIHYIYYLYVSFVSAVFVDGHFRRHTDLKLSCICKQLE